ncbi:hypothetical protein [Palleronia sp.]|uniref:hypothetical protein n=1 Tax=Palleronia sp. TaxID=1940284 RepID=UPI0035C7E903
MTLGPEGDLPAADVLVQDGRIAAIGAGVTSPEAEVVSGEGKILLPGFVDTHTHLWLSQMRGLFSRSATTAYFPLVERLGARYQPEDMRVGTLFGAAGNLDAGITTTFPYCDNIRQTQTPRCRRSSIQGRARASTIPGTTPSRPRTTSTSTTSALSLKGLNSKMKVLLNWPSAGACHRRMRRTRRRRGRLMSSWLRATLACRSRPISAGRTEFRSWRGWSRASYSDRTCC